MKTMRCLAIDSLRHNVEWIEKPIPQPDEYDALLRPLLLSPCTGDVHAMLSGTLPPGRVPGHGAVGQVVKTGRKVRDFRPGDVAAVPAVTPDYRSLSCQDGCPEYSGGFPCGLLPPGGEDGVFSEYFLVKDIDLNAAFIPPGVSPESALMCTDTVSAGFSGIETAETAFGDSVAVLGIGPVGLMAVAGAALRGAGRIVGVGHRALCRSLALSYGAGCTLDYRCEDLKRELINANSGVLYDCAIVCGGYSDVLSTALSVIRPGGRVVNLVGQSRPLEVQPADSCMWSSGKILTGGLSQGGRRRLERLMSLVSCGRLEPSKLITHSFNSFESVETALRMMIDPKPADLVKSIIYCEKE